MSPARALAWELLLRHRWGLAAIAAYAPALLLARALLLDRLAPANDLVFAFTVVVPLCTALFYLLVVFTFGGDGDLGGRASLFPQRLCRLPMSTTALAAWFQLFGAGTVVVLWVVTWGVALRPAGIDVPLLWPGLFLAVFVIWMQALTWLPYGLPMVRVIVTLTCLTTIDIAGILAMQYQVAESLMIAVLVPLLPLGMVTARHAVARARRGDVPDWRIRALRGGSAARTTIRTVAPFRSARAAQLWLEWRQHGLALPTLVAILVPCELLLLLVARDAPTLVVEIVLMAVVTPLVMAPFVAATVRKSGGGATDAHRLTAFQATRPIASADLVVPKLIASAASTLLAFTLVAICVPLALALTDTGAVISALWERLRVGGTLRAVAIVGSVAALLVVTTWKQLVQSLYVGLSGRAWAVRTYMALMLALMFAVVPVIDWFRINPAARHAFWDALPWFAAFGVIAKLGLASWLVRRLRQTRLVTRPTLATGLAAWFVGVLLSYALLEWLVPPALVSRALLLAGAILLVPFARLSAAPLALAQNRHR